MAIADDVLLDYTNKRIYGESTFLSGSTFYTVNEAYTDIMARLDDSGQMDDAVPFSQRSNVLTYYVANGWYIQQELTKHFKGASIATDDYTDSIRVLTLSASGYTSAVSGDIGKTVTGGTTGDTGVLLDYDNTAKKWWVRMVDSGDLFDDNDEALTIGSGTGAGNMSAVSATGEELFSNITTVGTVAAGYPYIEQNGDTITSWWGQGNVNTNHIDVLVKVKEADTLIDSGIIEVYNRNHAYTYDNSQVDCSAGGRNVAPLATEADSAATLTSAQIDDYIDAAHGGTGSTAQITVSFGSWTADINDDGTNENYKVKVDCDSQAMNIVYQALQWICNKDRTAQTINSAPAELYQAADGAYSPTKKNPFGQYAGGTLLFSRGVYPINPGGVNYKSRSNEDVEYSPPSSIAVAVTGLVSGDQVAVFLTSTGTVNKTQYTSHTSSNTSGAGTFTISTAIPKDTPSAGYIRVVDVTDNTEQRYQYTSWTGSAFTLSGTLSRTYDGSDKAYVGYIDEAASGASITKTVQYVSDRDVVVRVRNSAPGGNQIVPYEVSAQITSSGLAVPASRSPDYVIGN